MKITELTPLSTKPIRIYDLDGIEIDAEFSWNKSKVTTISLSLNIPSHINEDYVYGNICCKCGNYPSTDVYFLELHFLKRSGEFQRNEKEVITEICDLEVNEGTMIVVNRFIYEKEEQIKICKFDYGISDQPERKKGNILVGG